MQPKQIGSTIEPAFRTVLQQTCPKWKAESVFSDLKSLEQKLNATELWSHIMLENNNAKTACHQNPQISILTF